MEYSLLVGSVKLWHRGVIWGNRKMDHLLLMYQRIKLTSCNHNMLKLLLEQTTLFIDDSIDALQCLRFYQHQIKLLKKIYLILFYNYDINNLLNLIKEWTCPIIFLLMTSFKRFEERNRMHQNEEQQIITTVLPPIVTTTYNSPLSYPIHSSNIYQTQAHNFNNSRMQEPQVDTFRRSATASNVPSQPLSRMEYIPYQRKKAGYETKQIVEKVPIQKTIIQYQAVKKINYVPKEKVITDYYVVEHQTAYIPRNIEEKIIEYVPIEKYGERIEYKPVEKQIVHYPKDYSPVAGVGVSPNLLNVPQTVITPPSVNQSNIAGSFNIQQKSNNISNNQSYTQQKLVNQSKEILKIPNNKPSNEDTVQISILNTSYQKGPQQTIINQLGAFSAISGNPFGLSSGQNCYVPYFNPITPGPDGGSSVTPMGGLGYSIIKSQKGAQPGGYDKFEQFNVQKQYQPPFVFIPPINNPIQMNVSNAFPNPLQFHIPSVYSTAGWFPNDGPYFVPVTGPFRPQLLNVPPFNPFNPMNLSHPFPPTHNPIQPAQIQKSTANQQQNVEINAQQEDIYSNQEEGSSESDADRSEQSEEEGFD